MVQSLSTFLASGMEVATIMAMAVVVGSVAAGVFCRYVLNRPLGWTEEVTVLCWVWLVLWGASFVVAEADEVRFDIVYNDVPASARRAFTIVASAALVVLMALSLPATWRYVAFMRREHSAYLGMRFDVLYSIYVVFALACIVRQARVAWRAWRGSAPSASTEIGEDRVA